MRCTRARLRSSPYSCRPTTNTRAYRPVESTYGARLPEAVMYASRSWNVAFVSRSSACLTAVVREPPSAPVSTTISVGVSAPEPTRSRRSATPRTELLPVGSAAIEPGRTRQPPAAADERQEHGLQRRGSRHRHDRDEKAADPERPHERHGHYEEEREPDCDR